IGTRGIEISETRFAELTQAPTPRNAKETLSFLCKLAWVRNFLPRYAELEIPLRQVTAKDAAFQWGAEQQDAFDKLRELVRSAGILRHPRRGVPYTITCDASQLGCGGWLTQPDAGTDEPRAIASCSRRFNQTELRSYSATEREAVAVKYC